MKDMVALVQSELMELTEKNVLQFIKDNPDMDWIELATFFKGGTKINTTKEFQIMMQILLENDKIKLNRNLRAEIS